MDIAATALDLSAEKMIAAACADAGLNDFGDIDPREGLAHYLADVRKYVVLNEAGRTGLPANIHRWLVNGLRFVDDLKKHPEILDEQVDDPLIILGLPRVGSTKMQRLIAADSDTLSIKFWETLNPSRMPNVVENEEDPRIGIARQVVDAMTENGVGLMQSHLMQLEFVEEDIYLQLPTFRTVGHCFVLPTPDYYDWVSAQSMHGTYLYHKRMLQYLQWQKGGRQGPNGDKPWILKTPPHLGHMDSLVHFFPNAQYVFLHRDIHEVMASTCRLMEMLYRMQTDVVDMNALGSDMLRIWSTEMKRHLEQLDALRSSINLLDVQYERFRKDAFGVVADIYQLMGRDLTPQREQAMREWDANDSHGSFGSYKYSLEQYGLTPAAVDAAFAEYNRRYFPQPT